MKNIKSSWAEPYKIKMVELLKMTTPSGPTEKIHAGSGLQYIFTKVRRRLY
jgi:hypothetical protein